MHDILTLVRLNILGLTLWTHVVAATTPNVNPFCSIVGAAIIVDVFLLLFFLFSLLLKTRMLQNGK
jgi:hypothetical protein